MEEQKGSAAPSSDAKLKKTMYVLVAVAVVLGAVLAYVWFERTSLINDLNVEKDDLTAQMVALQNDYASLSSIFCLLVNVSPGSLLNVFVVLESYLQVRRWWCL